FGPDGRVLGAAEGQKVKALFEAGTTRTVPWNEVGAARPYRQADETHGDLVLQLVKVTHIRGRRFRAVLAGNGGAGGPLGVGLWQALAVDVTAIHCEPDGVFRHEPEPTEENLKGICPLVKRNKADVGFALDPDSDRLAVIDETGRYIGEELTMA